MCTKMRLPYFDTFAIKAGATSFDGMHYGLGVNMLKAQLLLNYIREQMWGGSANASREAVTQ